MHVFNVIEHGRRWMRLLVYASDMARCYGSPLSGVETVLKVPRPHWAAGDLAAAASPHNSVIISRYVSQDAPPQQYIPCRLLNGLLPSGLLEPYTFYQNPDGSLVAQRPVSAAPATAPTGLTSAGVGTHSAVSLVQVITNY